MPDGLSGTLDTTAVLLFFALPLSVALGGALFIPWRRRWWNLDHFAAVLARHGWVVAGLVLMLVPPVLQSQVDPFITAWLGYDLTPALAAMDGNLHQELQAALQGDFLRHLFTFVYVAGYPFLIIFTVMHAVWLDRRALARRALGAYAACYAMALPFYLFFPVREVWHFHDPANQGAVVNLAIQNLWVKEHLYSFNEINNCFPSLHTGISAAMAGVAWASPSRAYRYAAAAMAAAIAFSTIYLGIHWVLDVAAGFAVAAIAVVLVHRIWPEPRREPAPAPVAAPAAAPPE
jgi:membrane-associated phospholipid phosphatase